jgi:hypothetical protein
MNIQFIPESCCRWFGYGFLFGLGIFLILYWITTEYSEYQNKKKREQDGVNEIYNGSSSKPAKDFTGTDERR